MIFRVPTCLFSSVLTDPLGPGTPQFHSYHGALKPLGGTKGLLVVSLLFCIIEEGEKEEINENLNLGLNFCLVEHFILSPSPAVVVILEWQQQKHFIIGNKS